MDISIFISCYNEQATIIPTLNSVISALIKTSLLWEIIIIDDCSKDNSINVIQRYMRSHPDYTIYLHRHEKNCGLDPSIFEAARLGKGRYFWCVAGDNPVPTEACLALLSKVGQTDLIIPYVLTYLGRTYFRRALSWMYAFLVRLISGCPIRYYNGSSIYLREQFIQQMEKITGFTYSAELLVSLFDAGCNYLEVPVIYTERTEGKSTAFTGSHMLDAAWFFGRMLKRRAKKFMSSNRDKSIILNHEPERSSNPEMGD